MCCVLTACVTAWPGFEPRARLATPPRGIYFFTVIFDRLGSVRARPGRRCTRARVRVLSRSRMHMHIAHGVRGACTRTALSLRMYALHLLRCLLAAGAAVASHKCHYRVRHFGRVFRFPVCKAHDPCVSPCDVCGAVGLRFCKEIGVFEREILKNFLASRGRRLTAGAARFWPYDTFFRHLLGFRVSCRILVLLSANF